ncbi:MAG: valine--tRNA ligase [Bdellovibrionales bacterium]|nr:valine--tRNA ligase [Bdellovibrionales bacterium]
MDKAYEASVHDAKWQAFWDKNELFRPETAQKKRKARASGESFSIVMPPPNVTGVLHQGHALMLALEDTLTRWHRMLGDDTLYLPGSDHASIAVQMQVAKHLEAQKIDYRSLGREKFLEESWKWIREYQPRIFAQIKKMGTSCDWSRVKFTMDPELNDAVTHAFVELHKRGLIYRAERLVNWSPKGQTGLSDLEVVFEEREGSLWHIRYPVVGESGRFLVVATTRPETMLGDSAVAVHPADERYRGLIGKKVKLPFTGREIPVIGDDFVDRTFGSGVVKITPAHDHTDFEVGKRHNLPFINILTKDAKIVAGLPGEAGALAGLDRFKARDRMVEELQAQGLLEKIDKHKLRLGLSERWKDVVEPYLSTQWYLKMDGMAAKAVKAVNAGEVDFVPGEFKNQFMRWMENIHDWCISRQLWWGQQIPAWHCAGCAHVEVAASAPKACSKCKGTKLEQDSDVLDTWFSSGLWPFSTLGWPNEKAPDFKKYYPNTVMETGFDILFFWVARMLMMGLEFTGQSPFAKVYLHPLVRDEHGDKMSKTKGNVIDPLDVIRDYGADTFRFTLNALCVQGRDMRLSEERLLTYRAFINKVWNAARFALMGEGDTPTAHWQTRPLATHLHDRWILSRLDVAARDLNRAWSEFRMQEAAETIYHFVWDDFCDWYLEAAKTTRAESQRVVLYVQGEILKMLHPICPHATEELWHAMPGIDANSSLSLEAFPVGEGFPDTEALAEFAFVQECVRGIRNLRSEAKVPLSKKIRALTGAGGEKTFGALRSANKVIEALARLESFTPGAVKGAGDSTTTKVVVASLEAGTSLDIHVPLTELVDVGEEKARLAKEIEGLEKIVASQQSKLGNESFVGRAPPEVVDKERLKLTEAQDKLVRNREALKKLEA